MYPAGPLNVSPLDPAKRYFCFLMICGPLATRLHPSKGCWWESPAAVAALRMPEGCKEERETGTKVRAISGDNLRAQIQSFQPRLCQALGRLGQESAGRPAGAALGPGGGAPRAAGNHRPTLLRKPQNVRRPPVLVPVLLWLLRVRHD